MLLRSGWNKRRTVSAPSSCPANRSWYLVLLALGAPGCREATQVQLELVTDAMCGDVRDTSITISSAAELEGALPDTTTDRCITPGSRIGSLTAVPSGADDAAFSIRVVTGLGKSADACIADHYQGGCIVARRSLNFIPHRTLHVPIKMEVICRDIPCDATQTFKSGSCVDARITDVDSCTDGRGCDVNVGGGATISQGGGGGQAGAIAAGGMQVSTAGATLGSSTAAAGRAATGGLGGLGVGGTTTVISSAGGSISLGGTPSTGGDTSFGGISPTGGDTSFGGISSTGGTSSTGGITAASGGGAMTMAGASGSGSNQGGAANGGVAGTTVAGTAGLPSICGDGILNPYAGEYCDTAGDSASCNANCWPARCGDGMVNPAANEQCDGDTASVDCTPHCRISSCGDGFVDRDNGEECELGMGGCFDCKQDEAGQFGTLTVESLRSEPSGSSVDFDVVVYNVGQAVLANELSFRYYFTPDSSQVQTIACSWSDIACSNVTMSVSALAAPCAMASHYADVRIKLAANLTMGSRVEVEGRIQGTTASNYDFTNDYSRAPSTLPLPTQTVTLYRNDQLIWGKPPCGCGNGVLDTGEACDHGGESEFCNADCTIASCGDGKVNTAAGESCDDARPSLTCSPHCRATGLPGSASSSLLQWVDASQPDSIDKGLNVAAIHDQSGRGNDLTQAVNRNQPLWFPRAFGNLPGLFFDGVAHEMSASNAVNDVGRGSIFIVHLVEAVGLTVTLLANGWASSGGGFALRAKPQLDGLGLAFGAATGFSTVQWTLGARTGNGPPSPAVTYWAWDPPTFAWASRGEAEVLAAAASYGSTGEPLRVGGLNAAEPFRGWIGELLLFDRALSTDERDRILEYLRTKWGLP